MNDSNYEICCPEFHPEKWDKKTWNWENKQFIKETIPTFFHMPFPPMIGKKITKMSELSEKAAAMPEDKEEMLVLFADPSAFKSEIYLSVMKNVPDAENVTIAGTFMSRVFEGAFSAVPKFIKEMDKELAESGKRSKKYYIHYSYCPKCAEKFGHNYMILFAEI